MTPTQPKANPKPIMPRFTDEIAKELKSLMLTRAPNFYFTAEDRAELVAKTGLIDEQIMQWARDLRRLEPELQLKFLNCEKLDGEKVRFF